MGAFELCVGLARVRALTGLRPRGESGKIIFKVYKNSRLFIWRFTGLLLPLSCQSVITNRIPDTLVADLIQRNGRWLFIPFESVVARASGTITGRSPACKK
jgi:hypothetical protein